ncbi:MAG: hypothetical protein ABSG91_08040 [Syntrophobacteraceae bacterium]|jgi:hypothetical protein
MPEIRYVCLSDMHLGAETSLLTDLGAHGEVQPGRPSPVLRRLAECLGALISENQGNGVKPTLILNGDILELALAQDNNAAMAFQRFIDVTMLDRDPLFGSIIFNPGNHDHHLWETARETQFAEYVNGLAWDKRIEPAWHASRIFKEPVESYFFNRLLKRHPKLLDLKIDTAYPNFGLLSKDLRKGIIFHHGHLTEEIYSLMSILKTMLFPGSKVPMDVWGIEGENFAWIDFFWSALGRSGDAGAGVGRVYEKLQDKEQVKKLLHNLADGLTIKYGRSGWLAKLMEESFIELICNAVVDGMGSLERHNTDVELSKKSEDGLKYYIEWPLKNHIVDELGFSPDKLTFVFGHTHKPWQDIRPGKRYSEPVLVYNSGGWVVDRVERDGKYGASVILVDENLDVVSLLMYKEKGNDADYLVSVGAALRQGETETPFCSNIKKIVLADSEPWKTFSSTVASEVRLRAEYLKERIKQQSLPEAGLSPPQA